MKIPFCNRKIIERFRHILDVYPYHYYSGKTLIVARKWPSKPIERSGYFEKTHLAASICMDCYRDLCVSYLSHVRSSWNCYNDLPLDYFRRYHQSVSYHLGLCPAVLCVQIESRGKEGQPSQVLIFHSDDSRWICYYEPFFDTVLPHIVTTRKNRKGYQKCCKSPRNLPPNALEPLEVSKNYSRFLVPDNSLFVFQLRKEGGNGKHEIEIVCDSSNSFSNSLNMYYKKRNYGNLWWLACQQGPPLYRALLSFSLPVLPSGAIIDSALFVFNRNNDHPSYLCRYKTSCILEEWKPLESSWNNRLIGIPWSSSGGSHGGPSWEDSEPTVSPFVHNIVEHLAYAYSGEPFFGLYLETFPGYTYPAIASPFAGLESFRPRVKIVYHVPSSIDYILPRSFPLILNNSLRLPPFD